MSDARCYECGGPLVSGTSELPVSFGTRRTTVEIEGETCQACGETFHAPADVERAQRAAADKIRIDEGLLTPGELIAIRTRFGLTQAEMERLLGVGPKTVVRWERGTVFQNRATDALLRILAAVPEAYAFQAKRSGLVAPPKRRTS